VFAIPPAAVSLDDVVLILRERLRLYGDLQVYVIAETCGGERDPRLGVVRDHPEVTVELLCDQEDGTATSHWQAVRITAHDRCGWRGPHRGCDTFEVVQFVDDLLRMHPSALTDRCRLLC
jgi:hypothetical protein